MNRFTGVVSGLLLTAIATVGCAGGGDGQGGPVEQAQAQAQAQLQVGQRPTRTRYLEDLERSRRPKPPPQAVTAEARAKLEQFDRAVRANEGAWVNLPENERSRRRAQLKHDIIFGRPALADQR
jgi:hypothetical protein